MNANKKLLQVSLLGQFSLKYGDTAVTGIKTLSHQALFAYLLLNREKILSRRQLAFQFWPDSSESQARTNLRKAIYHLRHTLPEADCFFQCIGQTVQWNANAPFLLDVVEFEHCLKPDNLVAEEQNLQNAVTLYTGDFMPGHYEDWILVTRENLRQKFIACLDSLIGFFENERDYPQAIRYARRLLREDPLHEATYRRLMCLQALAGNVAGALRVYHTCVTTLQQELDASPSQLTKETYKRLLQIEAPTESPFPIRIPLVGREDSWSKMQKTWQQAGSQPPQVVLLKGEAGIGKTRLAEEMIDWATRQGIVALTAVCYHSEKQLAYAPVAKWLRSETLQPIFHRLDKRRLGECSRLLPEIQAQYPDVPVPDPLKESWQRQHFFSILAQTFLSLPQPFLLFIDDITWCDQDTLDWLLFLLHYDPQVRFLLLCSGRSEEIGPDHELIPWQQQLERESQLTKISLSRLDASASTRLAGIVLKKELDGQQAAHLYAETEGNPLFIVEIARNGLISRLSPHHAFALPAKVQAVIESRLSALSPAAYELAQLAAVMGHSFSFNLLQRVSSLDDDHLIHSLNELWQHRIVRDREIDAYDFSHDKIRQVAYESLSGVGRRLWHQRVWQALSALHADNLGPVSGQIAFHCEAAGHYQKAITYYTRAAQAAQAIYANLDMVRYLERAIDLFSQVAVDAQQQGDIYEQLGDVFVVLGRFEEAEKALNSAVAMVEKGIFQARIYRKIANIYQLRRQHNEAFTFWQTAENRLSDSSNNWSKEVWQEWLWIQLDKSWVLYWTDRFTDLRILLDKIGPIVEKYGVDAQLGIYYQRQVMFSLRCDRYVLPDETIEYAKRSFNIMKKSGTKNQIAFSQFVLGITLKYQGWQGNFEEAEYHMKSALQLAEEIGDEIVQLRCLIHLSQNYIRQRKIDLGKTTLSQATSIALNANILEYVAIAEGLKAWFAWYQHDFALAQQSGEHALALSQDLPFGWPAKWVILWPLITISLKQNELGKAVEYAHMLLDPSQVRLPDEVTAVLQFAITAWENDQTDNCHAKLNQAVKLAETYQYL